jgi:hypothetical protein
MPSRSQFQVAIGIAAVVWAGMLLLQGAALRASYLRPYSFAVGAVIFCFLVFDRWLWRLKPVASIAGRPVLRGTWKGLLTSTWIDPSTGKQIPPIGVFLVVRQYYSMLSMSLVTTESPSTSLVGALDAPRHGVPTVSATYRNTPRLLLQNHSRIHHGALVLEVHGSPPTRLTGSYWTDRDTKGELTFDGRSSKLHTDFASAAADAYTTV